MANVQKIRELYDSFENKDMSWPEFLAEFTAVTSPARMQSDLAKVMSARCLEQSTRTKIDEAIN